MSQESYPGASSDGPEPVESLPIFEHVRHELFELSYHDDAAQFKDDILAMLMQHAEWEDGGLLWSVYSLPLADSSDSEAYYLTHHVLLLADFRENHKQSDDTALPIIRLITNELLRYEGRAYCIARDYLLDEDGDSQYCVDSTRLRLRGDDAVEEKTYAPVFFVDPFRKLILSNYQMTTPVIGVPSPDNRDVFIKPFGDFTDPLLLRDRIYNLEIGRELFRLIERLEPEASSKSPIAD